MSKSIVANGKVPKQTSPPQLATAQVALYMRVSSEDQAERGTIEAQRDFLRQFATLYELSIAEEYADDGVTGTIALGERPEGRRLLQDAATGRFGCVLLYRVDHLGRSLPALLDAHTALSKAGITIRSATEPFDTSTPIGTFLFQLLGSMAELDKSTIIERMTRGRDRVAKRGRQYYRPGIPTLQCPWDPNDAPLWQRHTGHRGEEMAALPHYWHAQQPRLHWTPHFQKQIRGR